MKGSALFMKVWILTLWHMKYLNNRKMIFFHEKLYLLTSITLIIIPILLDLRT